MHRNSSTRKSQTQTSSPISSRPSVAGSPTLPRPISETPAATLTSIRETGTNTINLIDDWRKKTLTSQELAGVLRASLTKHNALLNTTEEPNAATLDRLHDLNTALLDVQRAARAEVRPRKRHVVKVEIRKFFCIALPDVFPLCQTRVANAFQALEDTLPAPKSTPPTNTSQQDASPSAFEEATPSPSRPGWSDRGKTVVDTLGTGFQLAGGVGEMVPVAGSILKGIGSIGQTIVKILNGVIDNKEEALVLAKYVEDSTTTAVRITENGMQIGDKTKDMLKEFEATLTSVHGELEKFEAQGGFWQGMSHPRNKEVLAWCDAQIRRSFTQLQVHLSLDTVRLLSDLGDADAQRIRRDLLDRLGNADTGATDKANDAADLMCLPGTRSDLLDDVNRWASDPSSNRVLWVNGVAGCGKSAIAATIASRREEESQSATAIFHFSRSNQPRNKRVICSIARQLAQKVVRGTEGSPENLVLKSVQENSDIADTYISAQFKHLIGDPLSEIAPISPPTLIIIDALDEWDNYDGAAMLVDLIREYHSKLPPSIKFVLTSRKESHLSQAFGGPRVTPLVKSLALDIDAQTSVDQDICVYIKTHFDRIRSNSPELAGGDWPGTEAIEKLVKLSGGLFQWASTVVRFVEKGNHRGRLEEIFTRPNQLGDFDALYRLVFTTFLRSIDRDSIPILLQHVLGSIVVAPTPISLDTLVYLHAFDHNALENTTADINEILAALGSLLIVPVHSNEPIRVLHPSIIDFLTDQQRCTNLNLHVDRVAQNRRLALLCLQRLQRDLRRDICGVGDARKFNANPDVQELVSKHIPEPLRYGCRYWAEHLLASEVANGLELGVPLRNFCTGYMLYWFEAMSLTGMFQQAVAAIRVAEQWVTMCPPGSVDSRVRALLHDARRFLLMYSEPIRVNVAHIYLSALPTAPFGTNLARTYRGSESGGVRVLAGPIAEHWPGSLWVTDRHSGRVSCSAFSPDGRILASGSEDKTLRLWDVETGVQIEPTLMGHNDGATCLAFSSDCKILASGSADGTLRVWNVDTGAERGPTLMLHTGRITCLAFSFDGRTLVSGSSDGPLRLWDVKTGLRKGPTFKGHTESITCMAFSFDGKTLASGSANNPLRLWDVDAGVQKGPVLEGHTSGVSCLAFSPDGKTLASGSSNKNLRSYGSTENPLGLWDIETGSLKGPTLEGHTESITFLAFSSDGKTLISGSSASPLRIWNAETGAQKGPALKGNARSINCVAFLSDGRIFASGSHENTLYLWNVETGMQKEPTLEGHTGRITHMAFSSDGKTLASASSNDAVMSYISTYISLRIWDLGTGVQKGPEFGGTDSIARLETSSDGKILAWGSYDGTLRLWDVETGVQKVPTLKGHTRRISCLAFSSDGRILASGSRDTTLLWDVGTGMQKGPTLKGHTQSITCLAFSPDGKTLASGSRSPIDSETSPSRSENALYLWDVETGEQKKCAPRFRFRPMVLQFSPCGRKILVNFGFQWDIDKNAWVSLESPNNQLDYKTGSMTPKQIIMIGQDGWVRYDSVRWFWLPPVFGRKIHGELRNNRFVFWSGSLVRILDVSDIMYLIN